MWKDSSYSNGIQEAVLSALVRGRGVSPNRPANMMCFCMFLRSAWASSEAAGRIHDPINITDFIDMSVNIKNIFFMICFLIKALNGQGND